MMMMMMTFPCFDYYYLNLALFSEPSVRRHVLINLKKKFKSIDEAEAALGITVESYIDGSPDTHNQPSTSSNTQDDLNLSPSLSGKLSCLTQKQLIDVILESLALLQPTVDLVQLLVRFFNEQREIDALSVTDELYSWLATKVGISAPLLGFVRLSLEAMRRLQVNEKPNLVLKFCQCLATDRPDKSGPLMPMHRMPFGLVQYCIEFFTCTNVMQVIYFALKFYFLDRI